MRCAYLRTKMDYLAHADGLNEGADPLVSTSQRHYWCLRTMKPVGPDGVPVGEAVCAGERECFVAEGDA